MKLNKIWSWLFDYDEHEYSIIGSLKNIIRVLFSILLVGLIIYLFLTITGIKIFEDNSGRTHIILPASQSEE